MRITSGEEATTASHKAKPKVFNATIFAWSAWDAGGAAFNAVATTFVFTVYLTSDSFGPVTQNSELLGYGMAIAGVIVALFAPISGHRADRRGRGTFWLGVNSLLVVSMLLLMWTVSPESADSVLGRSIEAIFGPLASWIGGETTPINTMLLFGITLLGLGTIFFEFASVNYNAMLGRITSRETMGRVSGFGWACGYFGGIILLLTLFIVFIKSDNLLGLSGETGANFRWAMLFAGIWALILILPVLFKVPGQRVELSADEKHQSLWGSYRHLLRTVRRIYRKAPQVMYFLVASAIFRDGLAGVFTFGGVIAARTFGFTDGEVLLLGVALNVVAGVATASLGYLDDYIGPKKVMVISLVCLVSVSIAVFIFHDQPKWVFWVCAMFLSLWVGPAQSASRTFLARRIPPGLEGEIFGLYATTGRAVTPLAPWAFATAISIGADTHEPGYNAQYYGILGIAAVLLLGLILLLPVKDNLADDLSHDA